MGRHQVLLLAHRAEEAERVRAEADDADGEHAQEADGGGRQHACRERAMLGWGEDEERDQQSGGHLHADPGRERCGRPAKPR